MVSVFIRAQTFVLLPIGAVIYALLPYDFLNKSSESMLVFLVKFWRWFDQRLSDISSERDSESDTQH